MAPSRRPSPHYARTTCCDRGSGRPSLRAGGSTSRTPGVLRSRLSRACRGEPCDVLTSTPQIQSRGAAGWLPGGTAISTDPQLPPGAGVVCPRRDFGTGTQSACGASTFLRSQKGPPSFPPQPRRQAGPRPTLSMPRLCSFAEQTPLPRSRYGVSCVMRARHSSRNTCHWST